MCFLVDYVARRMLGRRFLSTYLAIPILNLQLFYLLWLALGMLFHDLCIMKTTSISKFVY